MKIDWYFVKKAAALVVVAVMVIGCNNYLDQRNTIKAEALKEQQELIEENERQLASQQSQAAAVTEAETETEEPAGKYEDGIYDGEAEGFGGLVQVRVTVEGGVIADVEILYAGKEDAAYLESATAVIDEMIETGDTDVDTVSGATYSSRGIIGAAQQALENAVP